MDVVYFLKERTKLIRFYYDQCIAPFTTIKHQIENELPPFDDPPYSEDEPAYLPEWMDADTSIQITGFSCISLLSDSLKLYFDCLQDRVICFNWCDEDSKKMAFKQGFLNAYRGMLGHILDTDWSDCPADFTIIEQVILARNRSQHGDDLRSIQVLHDEKTLVKHPRPFFVNERERESWMKGEGDAPSSLMMPSLEVTRESLFAAIEHVERLADWIDGRMDKAYAWRMSGR